MYENVWRYSIDYGMTGGFVIADNEEEAKEKIKKYHDQTKEFDWDVNELIIWKWTDDDFFNEDVPDVLNCY